MKERASAPGGCWEAKNIAKVAAAHELLCDVFYAMRDGCARRASQPRQAA